jgi:hypothetical protein
MMPCNGCYSDDDITVEEKENVYTYTNWYYIYHKSMAGILSRRSQLNLHVHY